MESFKCTSVCVCLQLQSRSVLKPSRRICGNKINLKKRYNHIIPSNISVYSRPRFMTKIVQNINRIKVIVKPLLFQKVTFIVTRDTLKNLNLYSNSLYSVSSVYTITKNLLTFKYRYKNIALQHDRQCYCDCLGFSYSTFGKRAVITKTATLKWNFFVFLLN